MHMARISAGSYDLNKWLFGGYDSDSITMFYGGPGTGKTNFCLLVAVSQAKKGKRVIYIDSEGGFSSERIKQLAKEDEKSVLGNIFLLQPTSFNEQKKAFEKLLEHLKSEASLVIVDGMTMLYRLASASAKEKGREEIQKINSELAEQLRTLAEIARKHNIPVIVTNQVYQWENESRMVAGDILKYWAKCHIELTNEKGKRTAFLRKHRSMPEKQIDFQIIDEGIKKKGWI